MTKAEQDIENNAASSLIEQLGKALHELETHKYASGDKVPWMEIEEHFRFLDTTLKRKIEELEAREKEYMQKEAETLGILAEREAAVVTKEQDYLDRVQDLKDAAVAAIAEARANHQPTMLEITGIDNKENKVSSSLGDINSPEEVFPPKKGENAERAVVEVKPRPELTQFCEQMDARGLLTFTMENQKSLYAIREELSVALESANEPARLVLDSLEGFYPPVENTQPIVKKDAALQGMRKSCTMFMEALAALMARIDPGADHLLDPEIKQQAKAIADEWKPNLASADIDATNGNSLEADAFLQLLSTFRIASEFNEEELCKLVLLVARRRQAPELCRSLGLAHKMPGIIESLINSGKQIEAVQFIHAFQLTERFPPVPLLKAYLKDSRRNSQGKGGAGGGVTGQHVDVNAQELAALRAVVRSVEEYKLEAEYPLDPLHKRVAQLVKSKADKKRVADFGKHKHSKKTRPNGGYRGFRAPSTAVGRQAPPSFADRIPYTGMPAERYPHVASNPYDYQAASQPAYGQAATDQRMYYYPQDDRVSAGPYDPASSSYSNYMSTSAVRSSQPPYM